MAKILRWFSCICFSLALLSVATLLFSDVFHHLQYTSIHQQLGALPLILIGLSYISFQLSIKHQRAEKVRGLLLGLAFVFWGSEQLLPPSSWVTVMDSFVITVFVVDIAFIIIEHFRHRDHEVL